VSRRQLQNLIDAERALGKVDASLTVDRLVMPGLTELVDKPPLAHLPEFMQRAQIIGPRLVLEGLRPIGP
jgi:hypothetical protein